MDNIELNAAVDTEKKMENKDTHTSIAPMSETGLRQKYGKLYEVAVTVDEDDENEGRKIRFLFARPSVASFNRYIKTMSKNAVPAITNFVRDNIIEEQLSDFERECDMYPGLALNMGHKLLSILGLGDNVNFRKL